MERLRQTCPVATHGRIVRVRAVVADVPEKIAGSVLRHRRTQVQTEGHIGDRRTRLAKLLDRDATHQYEPSAGVQLVGPAVDHRRQPRQRNVLATQIVER